MLFGFSKSMFNWVILDKLHIAVSFFFVVQLALLYLYFRLKAKDVLGKADISIQSRILFAVLGTF